MYIDINNYNKLNYLNQHNYNNLNNGNKKSKSPMPFLIDRSNKYHQSQKQNQRIVKWLGLGLETGIGDWDWWLGLVTGIGDWWLGGTMARTSRSKNNDDNQ